MELALTSAIRLPESHQPAIQRVTEALRTQGFGVLTRIDLHLAFREKLGVEHPQHTILGACNPPLAHRALLAEPMVALLLPCNVTVEEAPGGGSLVRFVNPAAMLEGIWAGDSPVLAEVALDAATRLERVAEALRQTAGVTG
jgi:uncharacterized protein (DUF302 family)